MTRTYPIVVRDRRTGEEFQGVVLAAIVRRAYGDGATLELGTRVGDATIHTVTGPYDRKVNARHVLGEVVVHHRSA